MDQDYLPDLMAQARKRDEVLLLAGLTVLTKDLAEYFAATGHGERDTQLLQGVYSAALNKDRAHWQSTGPQLFQTLRDSGLPQGFAAETVQGRPDLERLGDNAVIHEWTIEPGRHLFEGFGDHFRSAVCAADGPYARLQDGQLGQDKLPTAIAESVMASELTRGVFWLPLAVYFCLLLSRTTLSTYCQSGGGAQA